MNIVNYIKNPQKIFLTLASRGWFNWLSDRAYLEKYYLATIGEKLDLDNPQTFNEKLQWLKIYDRKPEYIKLVDKYEVKKYVSEKVGGQYVIPTLGVWNDFNEIDFSTLPEKFVLKCTHDSGGIFICKDKKKFAIGTARKKIKKNLKRNYYWKGREWPYKNVIPRIIAEQYMEEGSTQSDLLDYKFMCFNGKVKCIFTCTDRYSENGLKVTFYDLDWNILPFSRHYPVEKQPCKKPETFEEMIRIAEILSENIPFVRIDFYEVNKQVYFGEMTFFPGSGFEEFEPKEWDSTLGAWLELL